MTASQHPFRLKPPASRGYSERLNQRPEPVMPDILVDWLRAIWNHPSNRGRRFAAVGRAIRFQLGARIAGRRRVTTNIGDRSRLWVELGYKSSTLALYANPPNPEMRVWQRTPLNSQLFIDVGANVGTYSIVAAELGAQVLAVEPDPEAFAQLQANIELNRYPITAIQAAASNMKGQTRITQGTDTLNRIAHDSESGIFVRAVTVDELLGDRYAAGMKVDVEGFERLVLEGAQQALQEHRIGLIQLEWNRASEECPLGETREPTARLLKSWGYGLLKADQSGHLWPLQDLSGVGEVFARPGFR